MNDLTGCKFGRWTVLEFSHFYESVNSGKKPMWKCRCDCGNEKIIRESSLKNGDSKSCGCLLKEISSNLHSTHHGTNTRLFAVWDSMKRRCENPNDKAYHNYGGRGIKVCDEWKDFAVFRDWAMSTGYNEDAKRGECTLERIDSNGMYSPDNCKWCSMKEQSRNKRNTIYVEYNGTTKSLVEWAEITGVKYQAIWRRYNRGLPVEKILKELI